MRLPTSIIVVALATTALAQDSFSQFQGPPIWTETKPAIPQTIGPTSDLPLTILPIGSGTPTIDTSEFNVTSTEAPIAPPPPSDGSSISQPSGLASTPTAGSGSANPSASGSASATGSFAAPGSAVSSSTPASSGAVAPSGTASPSASAPPGSGSRLAPALSVLVTSVFGFIAVSLV